MPSRTTTPHLPLLIVVLSALLLSSVQALYFTSPQASSIYSPAAGQVITWHHQAGDAGVGTLILQSLEGTQVVLAKNLNLNSESLIFPPSISLPSTSTLYKLLIVDSNNPSFIYSSVGPFIISTFSSSSSSPTSFSSIPIQAPMNPKTPSPIPSSTVPSGSKNLTLLSISTLPSSPTITPSISMGTIVSTIQGNTSTNQLGMGTSTSRGMIVPISTGTTTPVVSSADRTTVGVRWTMGGVMIGSLSMMV